MLASMTPPSPMARVSCPLGARISVTLRRPCRSIAQCTTISMQEATVGVTNEASMLRPAKSGSVESLVRASLAPFA